MDPIKKVRKVINDIWTNKRKKILVLIGLCVIIPITIYYNYPDLIEYMKKKLKK
jgi:3-deoxy-D-arabino-heptulosonate 7-phosphate (DAHP) synthase